MESGYGVYSNLLLEQLQWMLNKYVNDAVYAPVYKYNALNLIADINALIANGTITAENNVIVKKLEIYWSLDDMPLRLVNFYALCLFFV